TPPGCDRPIAILVAGVSTRLPLNDTYRAFYDLITAAVTSAVANARAYEEERKRAEALAEIDRAKTAFFSNVSHEFRTPLTLMLGPLEDELAERVGPLPPARRARLETAHRNTLRLLKLVNTLLDFSRIEAGRVQASYEAINLDHYTVDLVSGFRSAIEKANLTLTVDCPPLPERVYVDKDMWEKVVLNLLSNAFKHTFDGGIHTTLTWCGDCVEFAVADSGVGIPEAELPRLFERFHRVKGAKSRTHEGTGIGLALVQELIRAHGGKMRVESREGRGSTFTVSLKTGRAHLPAERTEAPRSRPSTATGATAYVEEALHWVTDMPAQFASLSPHVGASVNVCDATDLPPGSRPRILWADDNADMRDYVRRLLAEHYDVTAFSDGATAVAAALAHPPDLVLTDIMMPGVDGFGVLRQLRADERTQTIPVILLSARAGEESSVEGLEAGADDYLVKPFSARELLARVRTHLELGKLRREWAAKLELEVQARTSELRQTTRNLEIQIDERKRAEEALRENEERTNFALSAGRMGVWEVDFAANQLTWSDTMAPVFGVTPDKAPKTTKEFFQLVHPNDRRRMEVSIERVFAGERNFAVEFRAIWPDGSTHWLYGSAQASYDGDGKPIRLIGIGVDISERKSLEEQLRQAQKLEAIGQLAGGVAHDFNNLLTAILGFSELLIAGLAPNAPERADLLEIKKAGERATGLTRQLLAFSRRQILQPAVLDINALIGGMEPMLKRLIIENVDFMVSLAPHVGRIKMDPTQLEQILVNLAVNAADAMARGGKLTIETANVTLDEHYQQRRLPVTPGEYVMLAVSDTGVGMDEATSGRIFEPFFTTKDVGKGTGLGLATVYGIVKQSGGDIHVYSEVGRGTTFKIYLPRVTAAASGASHQPRVPDEIARGSETILLVEDDDSVRRLVRLMLERTGYRVVEAGNPKEALRLANEFGRPIDLLLSDVIMPESEGPPLFNRLVREHPAVRVLYMSGYADEAIVRHGVLVEGTPFLQKPFTPRALTQKVRDVLDAPVPTTVSSQ
ncbi:MAG: two-component system sensor histidine kinase/response regulator, partial [Acidobacteria bacterium]